MRINKPFVCAAYDTIVEMTRLRIALVNFVVLAAVFLCHVDSNLWIKFPGEMVLKSESSKYEHFFGSLSFAAMYSLVASCILALMERLFPVGDTSEGATRSNRRSH